MILSSVIQIRLFYCHCHLIVIVGEKSSSGHLEFNTLQDAVEALVICNHIPLSGASKLIFLINIDRLEIQLFRN